MAGVKVDVSDMGFIKLVISTIYTFFLDNWFPGAGYYLGHEAISDTIKTQSDF
ncbi:hypothetical protein GCM10007049_28430 [Echinicola pacifica]|uniref:Uncharacterized protein n=1 Tax=Echinicola pacifica TaxID=346377 RepID=A0A918UU58_9BACT|nr:hypothetical protein GCM10007049_28430 [Echinicola pacifica]